VLFSSPDDKQITMKSWSSADPVDFAQTAITELDGTSGTRVTAPLQLDGRREPALRPDLA